MWIEINQIIVNLDNVNCVTVHTFEHATENGWIPAHRFNFISAAESDALDVEVEILDRDIDLFLNKFRSIPDLHSLLISKTKWD